MWQTPTMEHSVAIRINRPEVRRPTGRDGANTVLRLGKKKRKQLHSVDVH